MDKKYQKKKIEVSNTPIIHASQEAEQAVLGSILIDPGSYTIANEILTPESFYSTANKIIFEQIKWLYDQGITSDIIVLWERLKTAELIKDTGISLSYLSHLTDNSPNPLQIPFYAAIVKEKFIKREMNKIALEILENNRNADLLSKDLIEKAFENLFNIDSFQENKSTTKIAANNFIEEIKNRQGKDVIGISSGFDELDQVLKGIPKHAMVTVGAGTGVGKTISMVNMAVNMSEKGLRVLYITLEVPDIDLMEIIVPGLSEQDKEIKYDDLFNGKLNEQQLEHIETLSKKASELPIFFTWNTFKLNEIIMSIDFHIRRHKIDCVFIDHLQLLEDSSEYKEFVKQTGQLKQFASKRKIPIINVSQLNREMHKRADKEPNLGDLRNGGNLEQDSDIVMFLYKLDSSQSQVYLKVAKRRKAKESGDVYFEIVFDSEHRKVYLMKLDQKPKLEDDEETKTIRVRKNAKRKSTEKTNREEEPRQIFDY